MCSSGLRARLGRKVSGYSSFGVETHFFASRVPAVVLMCAYEGPLVWGSQDPTLSVFFGVPRIECKIPSPSVHT